MRRARLNLIILSLLAVSATSWADDPRPNDLMSGMTAAESITLSTFSPSVPLRNPLVIPDTETVFLSGKQLSRNKDYTLDADRGLIVLMVPYKKGDTLQVSYRHDPTRKPTGKGGALGFMAGQSFNMLGGQQKLMLGFGMARRLESGAIMSANVYGLGNKFGFRGGSVSGVIATADQRRVASSSLLDSSSAPVEAGEEGRGDAILQNLEVGLLGGKLLVSHQDIGRKFNGFQAFTDAGYSDAQVQALEKEKGLKRSGFELRDLGSANSKLSLGLRTVKDGHEEVQWRNIGTKLGPASFGYSSRRVDKSFSRFGDLSDSDAGQLRDEQGLYSERLEAGFDKGKVSSNFTQSKFSQDEADSLSTRSAFVKFPYVSLKFGDQTVGENYSLFKGTRLPDFNQISREKGLRRQNIDLGFDRGLKIKFEENWIKPIAKDAVGLFAQDASIGMRGWSLEHRNITSDSEFGKLGSLSDAELRDHVTTIANMHAPTGIPMRGDERNALISSPGVARTGTRLSLSPTGKTSFTAQHLTLTDQMDHSTIDQMAWQSQNLNLRWQNKHIGEGMKALPGLMEFERQRWGLISGASQSDFGLATTLFGNRKISFDSSILRHPEQEGFSRELWAFSQPGLSLSFGRRKVDQNFASVDQLYDPEKDLLISLRGFEQHESSFKWNGYRGLELETRLWDATHSETGERRHWGVTGGSWQFDRRTNIAYYHENRSIADPDSMRNNFDDQRWTLSRSFDKYGNLTISQQQVNYGGDDDTAPSMSKRSFSYDGKLSSRTSIATSRSESSYDDGTKETATSHTLNHQLSKRMGLSVTEGNIDRPDGQSDERQTSYGFWWDFGNGMKFNYESARRLDSTANGALKSQMSLTPGEVAGIAVGSAIYSENVVDKTRFENTGNLQLSTSKPLQLGMFRDVTFKFGADTYRDQHKFARENRSMGAGFRVGSSVFSWNYASQGTPTGEIGVDRTFGFATNQDPKSTIKANVMYKIRTLPGDKQVMIRDYSVTARLTKSMELTHNLQTNPEIAQPNMLLGSNPQQTRKAEWKLDFLGSGNTRAGLSWSEMRADDRNALSRTAGLNLTLNAKNPSPIQLFYGVEQNDRGADRRTLHRYSLRYDQRPGPNQLLSIFVGNLSTQHSRDTNQRIQNWQMRLEYQLRF